MPSSALDPRLAALLGRVWPRLPAGVARAGALGFAWTDVSTPFVRREGERVVAHVGVVELPLVIAGRRVRVGSIHAVCTDPDRRGRGLARGLMQETLAACAGRFGAPISGVRQSHRLRDQGGARLALDLDGHLRGDADAALDLLDVGDTLAQAHAGAGLHR